MNRGIRVIGAGFGRTGTSSLKDALEWLLGGRCYHMEEIILHKADHWAWYNFATGTTPAMDWQALLKDYVACVDFPICIYYRELMDAFPDAKVVLSLREPESWWRSWRGLMRAARVLRGLGLISPRIRRHIRMAETIIFDGIFEGSETLADNIAAYERHNAEVIATVPPERLLVWQTSDGWQPLCEFLDLPIPDRPFPHLNAAGSSLNAKMREYAARMVFNR